MINALKNKNRQWHKGYHIPKDTSVTNKTLFQFELVSNETIAYSQGLANLRGVSYGIAIKTNMNLDYQVLDSIEYNNKTYTVQALTPLLQDLNSPANRMIKQVYNKSIYWVLLLA